MRWRDWRSKLADQGLIVGVAAVATGFSWGTLVDSALVLASVAAFLAFGYDLNDRCDFAQDRRAGKPVAMRPPWWRAWSMAAVAAALLSATTPSTATMALAGSALIAGAAYSMRPLRLKERGFAGILIGAFAQRTLPAGVLVTTFSLDPTVAIPLLAWTAVWGARAMITHQAHDAEADRRAEVRTWARDLDRARLARVARVLGVVEVLALAMAITVGVSAVVAAAAVTLSVAITVALAFGRSRRGIRTTWIDFSAAPVYDGYTVAIPVAVAVVLVLESGAAGIAWVAMDALLRGPSVWASFDVFVDRPELDRAIPTSSPA